MQAPAADTVILSETTDGDYIVRRVLVKRQGDSDYSIRYLINLATLNATLNGNQKELGDLNNFVENMMRDTTTKVSSVSITGYSSPDGPRQFNETLARNRARNFKNYVDRKYNFSKKYDVKVSSVAEDWEMCRTLVAQSSMPERDAVLRIIDDSQSSEAKEQALKKMPSAWEYMARNILPPLRRVELVIDYGQGQVVEQRVMIPRPEPVVEVIEEQVTVCEPCCEVVDDSINGILVEMPEPGVDFGDGVSPEPMSMRQDVRDADRIARREAREADRIARTQLRAEKKIARKEYKAARKAEKAAAKSARDLQRM